MRRNLSVLTVLTLIGLGGFIFYVTKSLVKKEDKLPQVQVQEQSGTPSALPLESNAINVLLASQNESGETAVASLVEKDGKVLVVLNVMGTPIDIPQPAHIHLGACPTPGKVEYPLTNVLNGLSETLLDTSMEDLKKNLPLAINIHKSENEIKDYVACGDLVFTQ